MGKYKALTNFDEIRAIPDERMENYDVIRRHDHAMLEYFSMWMPFEDEATGEWRESRVPFVFATPKREYSMDSERKTAQAWEGDYPPTQMERIVYPGMTLSRVDATFDQSRFVYTEWRQLDFSDDLNMTMLSNFPIPYNFTYQLDFWSNSYHDLNAFVEQFARKFPRPTWWLDIEFPYPWHEQAVHMQSQGAFSMTSELEGGEQQRSLRGVGSVTVFGWIPLTPRWVRTVQRFGMDFIEEESGEILETYLTNVADKELFRETGEKTEILVWT